jgi:hypothetical protein
MDTDTKRFNPLFPSSEMSVQVIYRISDGGNAKEKLKNASKWNCLENSIRIFGKENMHLFADNCREETLGMIQKLGLNPVVISLGNAMSWRHAAQYAMDSFPGNQAVYLLEDDYLHLPSAPSALEEGLGIADYVTLYDHPDKYQSFGENGGPNPYIKNNAEQSQVWVSKTAHWKQTNSTTMTFCTRVKTLKEDWPVWQEFTSKGFPDDFGAFQFLQGIGNWENRLFGKKRVLISSIPGLSTHAETAWLSPLTNWDSIT